MENQIILSKESSESDIRKYFEAVLQLSEKDEEFPVNLDDVWPLVYGTKGNAISALKKTFVENVDYISKPIENQSLMQNHKRSENANNEVFMQNHKNQKGGQNKIDYYLSTSCLEYFIARKVRPVFEVYRQVFHKVAKTPKAFGVPKSFREALLLAAQQQEQIEQQQAQLEAKEQENAEQRMEIQQKDATIELQSGELKKSAPKVNYYDQTLQSKSTMTITEIGNELGLGGKELNRRLAEAGIIYKRDPSSKVWLLKKPYSNWNMSQLRTQTYTRSDGTIGTDHLTVYNERGRRFINALHRCNYDAKAAVALIRGEMQEQK